MTNFNQKIMKLLNFNLHLISIVLLLYKIMIYPRIKTMDIVPTATLWIALNAFAQSDWYDDVVSTFSNGSSVIANSLLLKAQSNPFTICDNL